MGQLDRGEITQAEFKSMYTPAFVGPWYWDAWTPLQMSRTTVVLDGLPASSNCAVDNRAAGASIDCGGDGVLQQCKVAFYYHPPGSTDTIVYHYVKGCDSDPIVVFGGGSNPTIVYYTSVTIEVIH